jgi:hypothetical protein
MEFFNKNELKVSTNDEKKNEKIVGMIVPESELSRDFATVFSEMPLSDIELEVDGKVLEAHKVILWGRYIFIFIFITS